MRRLALIPALLLALLVVFGSAQAQPCAPPPSGMVAWWPGEGNANDILSTNNGTLINGASFGAGKVGRHSVLMESAVASALSIPRR